MIKRSLLNPPELYDYSDPPVLLETQPVSINITSLIDSLNDWITFKAGLLGPADEDLSSYGEFVFSTESSPVQLQWEDYLTDSATQDQIDEIHTCCLESLQCKATLA